MEEQREPQVLAELNKKKWRPNLTAALQIVGLLTCVGGIGVAAVSTGTFSIAFGSAVAVGGALTTVVGCVKDWTSIKKCFCCTSNLDNLNRQIEEKENKARNKLSCCLEEARQIRDKQIPAKSKHIRTICKAVNLLGQGTEIASEIKDILVDIFKSNSDLLDNERLKDVIPNYVRKRVRQETENQNQRIEGQGTPLLETSLESVSYSNSKEGI